MSKKSRFDWSVADWSKTTKQLSEELGMTTKAVGHARKRRAPETVRTRGGISKDGWSEVEWSKPTKQIASEMGVTMGCAYLRRRKHAPHTSKGPGSPPTWKDRGFKSQKDMVNAWHRDWNKRNPKSEDQKKKISDYGKSRRIYAFQRDGFKTKEEWNSWKLSERMNSPCKECGSNEKIIAKDGYAACKPCRKKKNSEHLQIPGVKERRSIMAARTRQKLPDHYIADLFRKNVGVPVNLISKHPELIQAKREQIKILRELKPINRKKKQDAQESK